MNFQSYGSCSRPTSRVLAPPGGGASNIFGTPDPPAPVQKKPEVVEVKPVEQPAEVKKPAAEDNVRRNPITGDIIEDNKKVEESAAANEEKENKETKAPEAEEDPLKKYEPHLGPQKGFSGTRVAQPPGGRSNITFG